MTGTITTPTPALEVAGLRAAIAGAPVLHGIDLLVPAGTVTALLGRNGVGKTTTLRAVMGLVPSTGEIRLAGRDIQHRAVHERVRAGIGYVPENREVFGRLSVAENLRLAATGPQPRYERVYDLFPELAQRARQAAATLSGGQQQMLAIGRVLLHDHPLLLVDEPTKGLSPRFVAEVAEVLTRLEGTTLLLVEQNTAVVRRLAQRIVVLDHGTVVHTGTPGDLEDPETRRRLLGVSGARA